MKTYEPGQIRNVGLYGHQGTGKTTVAETLAFLGKATTRLCSVVEGNSNFDFDGEEIRRKSSMSTAVGWAEWGKNLVNIIDTPGDSNFAAEAVMSARPVQANASPSNFSGSANNAVRSCSIFMRMP